MIRLALLSVSDKSGIEDLAKALTEEFGFQIISSGGTARTLQAAGIPVTKVSDYTRSPEILGGRVKTLHPRIHGGILARTDEAGDLAELAENDIAGIELVVVNLYPFTQTIAKPDVTPAEAIENIDIGGPTMVRAAAKNHAYVTILCQPSQYEGYLSELRSNQAPSPEFRQARALDAFAHTATYDSAIANYFQKLSGAATVPETLTLAGNLRQTLRYGENPHQPAGWYQTATEGWSSAQLLQGKPLSYNNLVDLEAARSIISEFPEPIPTVAILKHTNPCGIAQAENLLDAYNRAFAADNVSAFGGIVALNCPLDGPTAEAMTQTFLECVVVPACNEEAKAVLAKKKNLRVLVLEDLLTGPSQTVKAIAGGFLVQAADNEPADPTTWEVVTQKQPTPAQQAELAFAWRAVKFVKSNAIVVTCDRATTGVGAGQMNRVGAVEIALKQAGEKAKGGVLASDGFFPFDDSVRTAAAAGISAIIQPGGSIRDKDSIAAADELGLVMVLTKRRHFLH